MDQTILNKLRNEYDGYSEWRGQFYGQNLIVFYHIEDAGKAEGFPAYIDNCAIRDETGAQVNLEIWEIDELVDKAFNARTSCAEQG